MKKTLYILFLAIAASSFQACNTTETHDRSNEHPSGTTQEGANDGEQARERAGDDTNDQGKEAANEHGH